MRQYRPKDSLATTKDDSLIFGNLEADADTRDMMWNFGLSKGQNCGAIFGGSILVNKMGAQDWFKFMAGELLFLFNEHLLIGKF